MSVLAYYKGSTITEIDRETYKKIQTDVDKMLVEGLRNGLDLKTQGHFAKERLDLLEKKLREYERKNPKTYFITIGKPRDWLLPAWGENWEYYRVEWYMHIATLLRLKVINNDDMNGWLFRI